MAQPIRPEIPLPIPVHPQAPVVGVVEPQNVDTESALPDLLSRTHQISFTKKVLEFFGIGQTASRARKSFVSMVWNLTWGFTQFVAVITMLFLLKFDFKSPLNQNVSEWNACDKPLGPWASLWVVRVFLASSLAFWEYIRDRQLNFPAESNIETANNSIPSAPANSSQLSQGEQGAVDPLSLPYTQLYSRLTIFSSLVTLVWFVTGNIFVYTSINTCRNAAPRLWWLNFAILCILYLMVLEVVILGFIVLIVAPILFIFWNIFLICVRRHPLQNPGMIKPDIGKLPKAIVDRIPLVYYIPPPPSDNLASETVTSHFYPPKPPKRRMLFALLHSKFRGTKLEPSDKPTQDLNENKSNFWADNWEQGQYPFVTLEGTRATCAICLNDFEAPPRRKVTNSHFYQKSQAEEPTTQMSTSNSADIAQETNIGPSTLKLQDAGAGPQPLRLLSCAHAFHKTCLDPWLMDMSGRCPICQKPVERTRPHKS